MFLICLAPVQSASAATYTVTTTADTGAGSLRAAIASANETLDPDTVEFAIPASDYNCTSGVCTISLTSGELAITSAATSGTLTITNLTGASNLLISGNNTSRVFIVNPEADLTINGVTITKGNGGGVIGSGFGGGIVNHSGTLTLTNSTVRGNTANNSGGGIYNVNGTLALTNSTISGNTANITGGGVFSSGESMTLTDSTVSGNTASFGGGIYNGILTMTLTNSTVSGNTAINYGGGIYNYGGTLNVRSVTVTQNKSTNASCPDCAGGINNFATANLKNTIIAGNTSAYAFASPDIGGAVSAGSNYNLIGNGQGMTGITHGNNGNQIGDSTNPIDPKLSALGNNGGATQTHVLLPGSPAIDKGNSFSLIIDQRGLARPVDLVTYSNAGDDGADIGAFEVQAVTTAASVSISGRVFAGSKRGLSNTLVYLVDARGETRVARTSSLGYYRFEDIAAGQTVTITVVSKRFQFAPQVLNIIEETDGVNFIVD